jgi:hypothetical protein
MKQPTQVRKKSKIYKKQTARQQQKSRKKQRLDGKTATEAEMHNVYLSWTSVS